MTDEILTVQHAFDEAELHGDTDRLESLLDDDFRFLGVDNSETDVQRYDGTAIVRGVQRCRATWRGTPLDLTVRVSDVWVRQAGTWKLAAVQFSTLG